MEHNGNVVYAKDFENRKRHADQERKITEIENHIPDGYQSDIRMYQKYCEASEQRESTQSFLDYLFVSVTEEGVKKNTWKKRVVALRKYFSIEHGIRFSESVQFRISLTRKLYREEGRERLVPIAKQTGHQSFETLDKHYLTVADATVDKFMEYKK